MVEPQQSSNQATGGKVPRWYRLAWFLGRAPDLTDRQWRVLGLVSAVSFFEMYDLYLFTLNLARIQRELGIAEGDLGYLGSVVRAGSLLSIFIAIAADRWGRRSMLMVTVVCYTILTGATAFSPNTESFVVLQFFARAFGAAELLIAAVVIAEEFPPGKRGWGIGALGAIQACGAGAASLLFSMVDIISDWPLLNALLSTASGATWVSLHHGGGVGMGFSQHAGLVICCDGTCDAAERVQRVLWNDPATGVMRHADAGYDIAIQCARENDLNLPMVNATSGKGSQQ